MLYLNVGCNIAVYFCIQGVEKKPFQSCWQHNRWAFLCKMAQRGSSSPPQSWMAGS